MEKKQFKQVYETLAARIYETKVKAVICQSSGINNMGFGSDQNDGDFN